MIQKNEEIENEIKYFKRRILQLTEDKENFMDNVTQMNINYEIRLCKKGLDKLLKDIAKD